MKLRMALLTLAIIALVAGPAQAMTVVTTTTASYPYQRWADKARVPTPDIQVEVVEESSESPAWPCRAEYGIPPACVFPEASRIFFATNQPSHSSWGLQAMFYHEAGHLVDARYLSDWSRSRYMYLAGFTSGWTDPPGTHLSPMEAFANSYSYCAVLGRKISEAKDYNPQTRRWFSPRTHFQICTLIARAMGGEALD
jgi:hypothetical protein